MRFHRSPPSGPTSLVLIEAEVVEDTEAATEVVSEVEVDRMAMLHTEPGEGQLVLTCRVYTDSYSFHSRS